MLNVPSVWFRNSPAFSADMRFVDGFQNQSSIFLLLLCCQIDFSLAGKGDFGR